MILMTYKQVIRDGTRETSVFEVELSEAGDRVEGLGDLVGAEANETHVQILQ